MAISVYDVGSTTSSAGASFSFTLAGAIPQTAAIFVYSQEFTNSAGANSSVSDSAGNTYTKLQHLVPNGGPASTGFGDLWLVANSASLSIGQTITYTKDTAGADSALSIFYVTGIKKVSPNDFIKTAIGASSNPTITSCSPTVSGELFVTTLGGEGLSAVTITQDSVNNWTAPFDSVADKVQFVTIGGGNQVNFGVGTKTYSPTFNVATNWIAGIFGFLPEVDVADWMTPLFELPLKTPSQIQSRFEVANSNYYAVPGQLLANFPPLSEPIRILQSLPRPAMPFAALQINYVQYNFALTDQFDKAALTINAFSNINAAQVVITEIPTQTSQVTIQEIKFTRGYS